MVLIVNLKSFEAHHTIALMDDNGRKTDISANVPIGMMNERIKDYADSYENINRIILTGNKTLYEGMLPILKELEEKMEVLWRF